jgi:hypothetical protein
VSDIQNCVTLATAPDVFKAPCFTKYRNNSVLTSTINSRKMTVGTSRADGTDEIFMEKFNLHSLMEETAIKMWKYEVDMNRYVVMRTSLNWSRRIYERA